MKKASLIVLSLLLLTGCPQQWVKVETGSESLKAERYSVELPANWVRIQTNDVLTITRDGPSLQKIRIQASTHDQAFKLTEKSARADMLPHELSELFVAELKKESGDDMPSFNMISNAPKSHAGHEAFRLHGSYLTEQGLEYELVAVGFTTDEHFYAISYTAPKLVFFKQGESAFENALRSLRPI